MRATATASMAIGAPRNSRIGTCRVGCSPRVISYMVRVVVSAKSTSPPTRRTIAGAVAMTKPPMPAVSVIAESPMSGLASSGP